MIIIGIPTYNEADSIVQAVQKIEKAILYYSKKQRVPSNEFILVNADNNSPDMTGQKFLNLKTKMKKKLIITNGRGKGRNLIAIFRFAKRIKALAVATIDADITTIQDDWIARLIDPIIQNKTDMTVPIYKRNRFEGSTTNHFAFPLIYSYFGQNIRQPIGGEFGFSDKMINYLLKQKVISSTYLYGIDIFCTIHAVGGGFKVKSVFLGKKWHKPSFPKIAPMFTEVATSAFDTIKHYQLQKTNNPYYKKTNNITVESRKPDPKAVNELLQFVYQKYMDQQSNYQSWLPANKCWYLAKATVAGLKIDEDRWVEILAKSIIKVTQDSITPLKMARMLMPIFIWRTNTFWQTIESFSTGQIEEVINRQAQLLRDKLI